MISARHHNNRRDRHNRHEEAGAYAHNKRRAQNSPRCIAVMNKFAHDNRIEAKRNNACEKRNHRKGVIKQTELLRTKVARHPYTDGESEDQTKYAICK